MSLASGAFLRMRRGAGRQRAFPGSAQARRRVADDNARPVRRGLVRYLVASAVALAAPVMAGPVDLYLGGPRFCPHDVPPGAVRINEAQAIARTRTMLPVGFCGPNTFVSDCTFDTDNQYDSWRIYVHQYKLRGGARDKGGLSHTYLILDAVGNCLAHIPGTEFGASN
jgi:hypothetical protein